MNQLQLKGTINPKGSTFAVWQGDELSFEVVLDGPTGGAALFRAGQRLAHIARAHWGTWELFQDGLLRGRLRKSGVSGPFPYPYVYSPVLSICVEGLDALFGSRIRSRVIFELTSGQGRYRVEQRRGEWEMKILGPSGAMAGEFQRTPDGYSLAIGDREDRFVILGIVLFLLKQIQDEAAEPDHVVVYSSPRWISPPHRKQRRRRRRWIDDPVTVPPRWARRLPFAPSPFPLIPPELRRRYRKLENALDRHFDENGAGPDRDARQRRRAEEPPQEKSSSREVPSSEEHYQL